MRWLLAGLLFALAVAMAIGTAAIRAENSLRRLEVERLHREVFDRTIELRRLSVEQLDEGSPEQLANALWLHLLDEAVRRQGAMQ
ncbi:MAG: hypothetical protein KA020_10950 [Planctomycetes bacterium]|jgi:hypothetical protein|nr:hypothetical protein [Planctomycetota bacterium]MCC7063508.1 hypothetical protein [Planctomycetota bacterium]